ncbi:MAG: ferredoxin [Rhodobacterales bacterium]|nr:ferredoxin [Rhodobacterales bacterium]
MADPTDKWEDNVGGEADVEGSRHVFYVDRECILCSVCSDHAPANFRMSDDEDHDICFQQPRTAAELSDCRSAMANCPVEAIGDDG